MTEHRYTRAWRHLAAVLLLAVTALWSNRAVLLEPATAVNFQPAPKWAGTLGGSDLRRSVSRQTFASRGLAADPLDFATGTMCYPSADSVTFGEHMLGEGVQGLPAYFLWDDPIVTFNFVVTIKPWIAAVSMYAFAFYWTRSVAGALIGGFLFGFNPIRLGDLAHAPVLANEWIPLILLSLDLLFTRRRWRYAFLLATVSSLQLLESMYVLVQCLSIVSIYGAYLAVRNPDALLAIMPKLVVVVLSVAATASWVFSPYLETREIWGILEKRSFWDGRILHPGYCLISLAALGLADRFWSARSRIDCDPRLPLVVAGLIVFWFVRPLRLPLTSFRIPRLGILTSGWLPGIDAIRAPSKISFGLVVPLALLAAFGVRVIQNRLGFAARTIVVGLIGAACVAEIFLPEVARWSFHRPLPSVAFHLRPAEEDLRAVRNLPDGPVLDLPGNYNYLWVDRLSRYVLLAAYHGHQTSSCKSSFLTPVQYGVNALARRLPDAAAARELWALGFRSIIFHAQDLEHVRIETDRILDGLSDPATGPHLVPIATGATLRVARLAADGPVTDDIAALSPTRRERDPQVVADGQVTFEISSDAATFRHPDPIQPTRLVLTWQREGQTVQVQVVRALLPLALAQGHRTGFTVRSRMPRASGTYLLTMAPADNPTSIIGSETVSVRRGQDRGSERSKIGEADGRASFLPSAG